MMIFTESTKQLIDKLYQGRKHVELTIGILRGGNKEVVHRNPDHPETESARDPVRTAGAMPGQRFGNERRSGR